MKAKRRNPNGNKKAASLWSQMEENLNKLAHLLKDAEFKALLDKHEEAYVAAEPTYELTDDDLQAIEEAKAAGARDQALEYARGLFKAAVKEKRSDPDSKLFQTAQKGLEIADQIKKGNISLWREFESISYTFVQLCRAECEKVAKTERGATPAKRGMFKRITVWIFKKTWRLIGAIIVGLIVAVLVIIFGDFGWIDQIKDFIYNILQLE